MKVRYVFIAFFTMGMISALPSASDINVITVDEMVVTATRSEQLGVVTPTSISVITAADIALTGASSLTDVLRSQAGIQINDNIGDGSRASVSMRGFGANSVNNILILVDGRKLNNPTLEAPLLSSIALKDIERIEILQGSGGVLFGDQAIGGVINIITKRPDKQQFYINTGIGSDDLNRVIFSTSQRFDNGIAYRLSGEKKKADNYRDNNAQDYRNLFGLVSYEDDWGDIFYERQDIDDQLELPGSLTSEQILTDRRQSLYRGDFSNQYVVIDRMGFRYHFSEQLTFDSDYSIRDSNGDGLITFISSGAPISTSFKQDTQVEILGARLLGDWEIRYGKVLLTLGYEHLDSDHQNDFFGSTDWEQEQQSLYSQFVIPVFKDVTLAIGARTTDVEDRNIISGAENGDSENATEIGFSYDLSASTQLFIRRAESFRFANIDENGFSSVDFLEPQTSTSIEAGYEYNAVHSVWKVVGYTIDIKDEIYYDGMAFANVNLDQSNRTGALIEARYDINLFLSVNGSYSRTKAAYKAGSFKGNDVPFVPEQTTTLGLNYALTPKVSLYADAIYTGRRFAAGDDANSGDQLGGYTIYNINLGYNSNLNGQNAAWNANLRVNNLTGKEYSGFSFVGGGYPAPKTTVEVNLGYRF